MTYKRDDDDVFLQRVERREKKHLAKGFSNKGSIAVTVNFDPSLFKSIHSEAKSRGWSFSRTVRHLCNASIEGIE